MKTYVITLSRAFMATHKKSGQPTDFARSFAAGQTCSKCKKKTPAFCMGECFLDSFRKIHTIRHNYPFWAERFKDIQAGVACLSVRQWTGKPYRSKQVEIARLTKDDGIGIERLTFEYSMTSQTPVVNGVPVPPKLLANNDGLSYEDWSEWFRGFILSSMAIIHFTPFRYTNS